MLLGNAIAFQDADFPHRLVRCWSALEGNHARWVPYGMPRLNPLLKHAVFFLYGKHPKTGKVVGPLGTGSLVAIGGASPPYVVEHLYAVTCHHVAVKIGASILRINTKDGKSRQIQLEPHEWQFIGRGDDLCAADITERVKETDLISAIPADLLMRRDFIELEQVEIGEDGFMLGLFAAHPGKKQNLVAARFGNLSLLAKDDEPIKQPNGQNRPSHIFDMRSRPGFSGSPVFLYRTPAGDLRTAADRGRIESMGRTVRRSMPGMLNQHDSIFDEMEIQENTFLMVLGVHCAQYHERVEARKIKKVTGETDDNIVRDRDRLRIPSSMAIVVPAWEIVNLLNLPFFKQIRERRDEMRRQQRDWDDIPEPEATIGPPVDQPSLPASDANPNHLGDFKRLVDVAARKRPQGGQT